MTLLEILQPTNIPRFNPKLGRIYRAQYLEERLERAKKVEPLLPITHQRCKVCGCIKLLAQFVTCKKYKTGYAPKCKQCLSEQRQGRASHAKKHKKDSAGSP